MRKVKDNSNSKIIDLLLWVIFAAGSLSLIVFFDYLMYNYWYIVAGVVVLVIVYLSKGSD